jgi:hypothetical protein
MPPKNNYTKGLLLARIIESYRRQIDDETFNGIKLQEINHGVPDDTLRTAICTLVTDRKIDIICPETQLNPHIKRHPPQPVDTQLQHLNVGEKYHTCLYPTEEVIKTEYDLTSFGAKPFTGMLAKGRPQLDPIFFEIGVLDRYRMDPRYLFQFHEYSGSLSMRSPSDKTGPIPERDQTSIQTFGLGLDEANNPHVCVFLRYLPQLSSEHQRHWESFTSNEPARMHVNYYKSSYLGEFYENNSAIAAIRLALESINAICRQVWGARLFINAVPKNVHYNLSPFMRPSKADYLSFVHELDKLVSDNIDAAFFEGKVDRYFSTSRQNGAVERTLKGTLTMLDEWLFSGHIGWQDVKEARREIIEPLRRIRRDRQQSAHAVIENSFDVQFTSMRREDLGDTAFALGNIAHALRKHPQSPTLALPNWFKEGRIEVI